MADWDINFGFTASAQSRKPTVRTIMTSRDGSGSVEDQRDAPARGFARLIVNEVALAATDEAYLEANRRLVRSVRDVALSEVSRMAMQISRSISVPDKRSGPYGTMSVKGGTFSQTAMNMWRGTSWYTMNRQETGIRWEKRRSDYLNRKRRQGFPAEWFLRTGALSEALQSPELYIQAFGPVHVTFTRQRGKAIENAQVTRSGRSGPFSTEYTVGRLSVVTFSKITPDMLSGLADMDPTKAEPSGSNSMAELIHDPVIRGKLTRRPEHAKIRYALEPFVSFFLTRALPNAIWRRTEDLIGNGDNRRGI